MTRPDYMDTGKQADERAYSLLALMTTEEKVGQLVQLFGWQTFDYDHSSGECRLTEAFQSRVAKGGIGSLYGTLRADPWTGVTLADGLSPRQGAEATNAIQRYVLEHSRLPIPLLFGEETSHGHMAIGATVFPVPLTLGSSWDTELYRQICEAIAVETRSQGGAAGYSPVLDVVRDPRWGRTEECYGEDPYLIGEFAQAAVRGMQGADPAADTSIAATVKHFVAYGSSEGGRNAGPAHIGQRELLTVDMPPFRKAVEAGVLSLMPAYNEIDGIPCSIHDELLTDVLRGEWGFDGMIISDCGAIDMLASGHDVAEDGEAAAIAALTAGLDMEMSGEMYSKHLLAAVESGKLAEAVLDQAAHRVLTLKFRLGLFEQPYCDPDRAEAVIGSPAHRALAHRAAVESAVLLKNTDGALPLTEDAGVVAVIGPNADRIYNQLGDYTSPQPRAQVATVLDGIRAKLTGTPERVLYAPGCRIKTEERDGFAAALATASQADTIVLVLGGSSARDFGEGSIDLCTGASLVTEHTESDMDCGEGIDRMDLGLSGVQLELAQELHQLGKRMVVVYINGRPIVEPWIEEHADAILEAWYPGQEGGHAIADLLFGDANPSGRLTLSIPVHVGQLPVYYNAKRSRGKRYLEGNSQPRYPFGFGLSYTHFHYANAKVTPEQMGPDDEAICTVEVTNVGSCAGAETVQFYVTDNYSSVTRPVKELKGFRKLRLEPGETATVSFPVGREQLQMLDKDLHWVVETGTFNLQVGPHSADGLTVMLHITGGE